MAGSKTALTVMRSLALAGTLVIFVLGMWSLIIIQTIDSSRGQRIFAALHTSLGAEDSSWSQFIVVARQGTTRIWVLVTANLITLFAALITIMSNRYYWLRISALGVLLLETASTISTIIAFGCALSLSLNLNAFRTPPLGSLDSRDLSLFATLNPLSRDLTITSSVTVSLLLITLLAHFINFVKQRRRVEDTRSFEPTVSALGMSHGFYALHPPTRTARAPIPTMYDPYRAFRKGPGASAVQAERISRPGALHSGIPAGGIASKHVGFADEGAWMSRKSDSRWSVSTTSPRRVEGDIMRLLEVRKAKEVKKSRRAVPVRPASAVWNGREVVHAL